LTALRMLKRAALFFKAALRLPGSTNALVRDSSGTVFFAKRWLLDIEGMWFIAIPLVFMAVHSVFHYEFRYVIPVWPALAWAGAHAFAGWPRQTGPAAPENAIGPAIRCR
jgi:hypothetical protein